MEPSGIVRVRNPVILQGAWMRVDLWYRSGDLAPQPELSRWRLYPEAMLRDLAETLLWGCPGPAQPTTLDVLSGYGASGMPLNDRTAD